MTRVPALALLLGLGVLVAPTPATAGGGGGESVGSGGSCSGTATWQLQVNREGDGPLEWEFEVESHRAEQQWRIRVVHNGRVIFSGKRRTHAPSRSISIEGKTGNQPGADHFSARARQLTKGKPGQLCRGGLSL
jgi:hypothetical protein